MRHNDGIFNRMLRLFWRLFGRGPMAVPKVLPPDILRQALDEARFLSGTHGVEVRELSPDEEPCMPRRADGGEEPKAHVESTS